MSHQPRCKGSYRRTRILGRRLETSYRASAVLVFSFRIGLALSPSENQSCLLSAPWCMRKGLLPSMINHTLGNVSSAITLSEKLLTARCAPFFRSGGRKAEVNSLPTNAHLLTKIGQRIKSNPSFLYLSDPYAASLRVSFSSEKAS